MELYKIDNHLKEHGSNLDLWTFDKTLSMFVKNQLQRELTLADLGNVNFKEVQNVLQETRNLDLDSSEAFKEIRNAFKLTVTDNDQIFIIWNMKEDVDVISTSTLCRYWDSIWYGVSDEAALLYIPNKFILLITHWGDVSVKSLN